MVFSSCQVAEATVHSVCVYVLSYFFASRRDIALLQLSQSLPGCSIS